MLTSFLTVGQQVVILFLIISAGFILGKVNMITESGNRTLSNIMVYVVSPCMMITAFQRELVPEDLQNFGMCFLSNM